MPAIQPVRTFTRVTTLLCILTEMQATKNSGWKTCISHILTIMHKLQTTIQLNATKPTNYEPHKLRVDNYLQITTNYIAFNCQRNYKILTDIKHSKLPNLCQLHTYLVKSQSIMTD